MYVFTYRLQRGNKKCCRWKTQGRKRNSLQEPSEWDRWMPTSTLAICQASVSFSLPRTNHNNGMLILWLVWFNVKLLFTRLLWSAQLFNWICQEEKGIGFYQRGTRLRRRRRGKKRGRQRGWMTWTWRLVRIPAVSDLSERMDAPLLPLLSLWLAVWICITFFFFFLLSKFY